VDRRRVMVAEARAAVESRLAIEQDGVVRGELAAALSPLDPE